MKNRRAPGSRWRRWASQAPAGGRGYSVAIENGIIAIGAESPHGMVLYRRRNHWLGAHREAMTTASAWPTMNTIRRRSRYLAKLSPSTAVGAGRRPAEPLHCLYLQAGPRAAIGRNPPSTALTQPGIGPSRRPAGPGQVMIAGNTRVDQTAMCSGSTRMANGTFETRCSGASGARR